MNNTKTTFLATAVLFFSACGERGEPNAPPVGTGTYTSAGNGTSSAGSDDTGASGASGMTAADDSSGGGGPTCTDCPEPDEPGAACPGSAEWDRAVLLVGIYQSNNVPSVHSLYPGTEEGTGTQCLDEAFGQCLAYDDPADVTGPGVADLWALQKAECEAMSLQQARALAPPSTGWTMVGFLCRQSLAMGTDIPLPNGGTYTYNGPARSCAGTPSYDGYCAESDCGEADVGTGTSGGVYACADWDSSSFTVERGKAHIAGPAWAMLQEAPYAALSQCGDVRVNSRGEIWHLGTGSKLRDLGVAEGDRIQSVDGETDLEDAFLLLLNGADEHTVVLRRGRISVTLHLTGEE